MISFKQKEPVLSKDFDVFLGIAGKAKYIYSEDGSEYFVSEMFSDPEQFGLNAVLLFIQRRSERGLDELVFRLPYMVLSRKIGYSDAETETIRKRIQNDQIEKAFRFSQRFMEEFGKDV